MLKAVRRTWFFPNSNRKWEWLESEEE